MQSGKIVVASAIADLRDSDLMRELYLGGGKRGRPKAENVGAR
jgi:hypothetical protein